MLNKYIDWKEVDYIKLIFELGTLSYLDLWAKVAIQAKCFPLKRKCAKAE